MLRGKGGRVVATGRCSNVERGVVTCIAKVERRPQLDPLRGHAFGKHFVTHRIAQRCEHTLERLHYLGRVRGVNAFGAEPHHVGQAHAIGAEQARIGMEQNLLHAKLLGHSAGMLPCRAAKGHQHVVGRIVTLSHRDRTDRARHVGVGHLQKAGRQLERRIVLAGGRGDLLGRLCQSALDRLLVEREGEAVGRHAPEDDVEIRDRERAAAAITRRAWISAGALGANGQLHAVEAAERTAAGGHGFDRQRGRHNADAGLLRFELELVAAVEAGNVGARAPHVEADGPWKAGRLGHA